MINGKPDWSCDLQHEDHWKIMIQHARDLSIEWGGDWTKKKLDEDHFQVRDGLTLEQARQED